MKAYVLKERGVTAYVEKPFPRLRAPHGVILKPLLVSPCTSDVHTVWQGSPKRADLTLGHECVAEVLKVGAQVQDFQPGDVVAVPAITPDWGHPEVEKNPAHAGVNFSAHMLGKSIDGAFQEAFYLPYADKNLAKLPESVSREAALMCVDVVTTGFTAVEEAGVKPGDTVVVMGIGAIGLAAIMGARLHGAARIFAVGSRKENVALARALGAEVINYRRCKCELPKGMHPLANATGSAVVNRVLKETGKKGADAVLICGGGDDALPQAVDMVKYGTGVVANVNYYGAKQSEAAPEPEATVQSHTEGEGLAAGQLQRADTQKPIDGILIPKFSIGRGMAGKTLKFSLAKGGRERVEYLLDLCRRGEIHPEVLVTERLNGLDRIDQALHDMKARKAIKIAVYL